MRVILTVARGLLRQEAKDRTNAFWMLALPMAFIGLFGGMFREGGGPRKAALAVVDADRSFLSGAFVDALSSDRLALRVLAPAERDTARGLVRILTIPHGFSDSLALGQRVGLRWETREGSDEEYGLAAKVQVYRAIARVLANLAEADTAGEGRSLPVGDPEFQRRFSEIGGRPDLVQVSARAAGRGRAIPAGFSGSAQAMLVLFLLMTTSMSGAVTLTQEKQNRVLARVAVMPLRRGELLAGKILGLLAIALVQSAIIILLGRLLFAVSWGTHPLPLLALLLCLGLASAALGIFLGGLLRTPEQAGAIAWLIPLLLGAIGGTWWPLEITPRWMQVVGHISPAAWAMDGMHGLIAFGKGGDAVLLPCGALLVYAAVLAFFGARWLRVEE